jgi:hypothetical protein
MTRQESVARARCGSALGACPAARDARGRLGVVGVARERRHGVAHLAARNRRHAFEEGARDGIDLHRELMRRKPLEALRQAVDGVLRHGA